MFARSAGGWVALLVLGSMTSFGCKSSHGKKGTDNNNPSVWSVGDDGMMIRIDADGETSSYPLESDADLLTIACHGTDTAWVAGEAGTILRTRDAGATWDPISLTGLTLATNPNWRALAVAEHTPEGSEAVWLVGEGGSIVHTPDAGETWIAVPGATVDFTGVATEPNGNWALAVADDGSIWTLDEAGASIVASADTPLRGIAIASHDLGTAIAVGDAGTMLRRAGEVWTPLELGTTRDLFAVRLASDGSSSVAVGEDGTVVSIAGTEISVWDASPGSPTLRALHLGDDGRSQAVGDAGRISFWVGASVTELEAATDMSLAGAPTLRGVDDFHAGAHL